MYRNLIFLLTLLAFTACNHIDVIDDEDGGNGNETEQPATNDRDNALTVADILSGTHTEEVVWVEGYIVGYTTGSSLASAVFGIPEGSQNTNFLLADNPDEESTENIVPVELPKGAKRNTLNLYDHPELLGRRIRLEALATTYFRVPGLKRLYAYELLTNDNGGNNGNGENPNSGLVLPIDHEACILEGR